MEHHIYTLSDPRDGSIRYVGMSQNAFKRYGAHLLGTGTDGVEKTAWIEDLLDNEMLPVLTIIDRVDGREEAFAKETYWIKKLTEEGVLLLNKASIVRRELTDARKAREGVERRSEWLRNAQIARAKSEEEDKIAADLLSIGDIVYHASVIERNREKMTVMVVEGTKAYVQDPRTKRMYWCSASILRRFANSQNLSH